MMKRIILIASLAAIAIGIVLKAQAQTRTALLRVDSLQAAMDTTRLVVVTALGDSIQAWERRAVQQEIAHDALAEDLQLSERARAASEVRVRALRASVGAEVVVQPDGDRHASFRVRQEPYTVLANVTLPAPPEDGRLSVSVFLDSLRLTTRVGCREVDGGAAQAVVVITGPEWVTLDIQDPQTDPSVCNPPAPLSAVLPQGGGRAVSHIVGGALAGGVAGRDLVSVIAGGGVGFLVHRITAWLPWL